MIVYKVVNTKNGKIYVGQTQKSLNVRRNEHNSSARNGNNAYFHKAIRKHGEGSFKWSVIDRADKLEDLHEKERYWISYYQSFSKKGYNLTHGGEGGTFLNEVKDRMAKAKNDRVFLVFDKNTGRLVGEFVNAARVARELGVSHSSVVESLNQTVNLTYVGDYIFIYKDEYNPEEFSKTLKDVRIRSGIEPIVAINIFDKKERVFKGKQDVLNNLKRITRTTLNACLSGHKVSEHGYCFIYESDYTKEKVKNILSRAAPKRREEFVGYDLSGKKIGQWKIKAQASRDLDVDSRRICENLLGQRDNVDDRFRFKYISEIS